MEEIQNSIRPPRAGWADALRVLAMLSVVMLHCAVLPVGTETPGDTRFWVINLLDGGVRWGVPVFVMLSGAFLLDPKKEMNTGQWLSHVGRVALLTVFWGGVYALYAARGAHLGLEWLLEGLISLVTGRLYYHLWFLPMLLGLYILLPILRAFVKGADRKTLWYAALLWAVAVPGLDVLFSIWPNIAGHGWFTALDLRHLYGYGGYFLFGYLLRTCEIRPKRAYCLYAAGVLGLVVTWWTTYTASLKLGRFSGMLYANLTPNVCATALAIFLAFRHLDIGKRPFWAKLSALSLGVFVLHPLFIDLTVRLDFPPEAWNLALSIPLRCLLVTALSLAAAWLLRKLPKAGKLIA